MAIGTTQMILVCSPTGTTNFGACPSGTKATFIEGYIGNPESAAMFDNLAIPFSMQTGIGFFSFAFTTIISLYLLGFGIKQIINLIRGA